MKFLIQKIHGEVRHDFSFALLESIRFNNWLHGNNDMKVRFIEYNDEIPEPNDIYPMPFKLSHKSFVPIGSVEFVNDFLQHFYNIELKPINVPEELFEFAHRRIYNGTEIDRPNFRKGFAKSNSGIKKFTSIIEPGDTLPPDNYQFSEYIAIDSEWRAFVYMGKLVGLQNYSGEFTLFPNIFRIKQMIEAYKSAPIAYTLDVGVNDRGTFVIECHLLMSTGLYGFSDHKVLPYMFYKCFHEFIQREGKYE